MEHILILTPGREWQRAFIEGVAEGLEGPDGDEEEEEEEVVVIGDPCQVTKRRHATVAPVTAVARHRATSPTGQAGAAGTPERDATVR